MVTALQLASICIRYEPQYAGSVRMYGAASVRSVGMDMALCACLPVCVKAVTLAVALGGV